MPQRHLLCKIRRRCVSSYCTHFVICSPSCFHTMSLLAGARPKRLSKKYPTLYDLPSHLLFSENLNLDEEEDAHDDTTNHISHVTTKQPKQPKHSKSKSTTVPVSSPRPISPEDSGAKLTYNQQIQLVQLQKEKLQ